MVTKRGHADQSPRHIRRRLDVCTLGTASGRTEADLPGRASAHRLLSNLPFLCGKAGNRTVVVEDLNILFSVSSPTGQGANSLTISRLGTE